jgi:hypothetical protein
MASQVPTTIGPEATAQATGQNLDKTIVLVSARSDHQGGNSFTPNRQSPDIHGTAYRPSALVPALTFNWLS